MIGKILRGEQQPTALIEIRKQTVDLHSFDRRVPVITGEPEDNRVLPQGRLIRRIDLRCPPNPGARVPQIKGYAR